MKFNLNTKLMPIILILLSVVVAVVSVYAWFSNGTILYYWDTLLPLDNKNSFENFFYYWHTGSFPGGSGSGWSWLPYWMFIALFRTLASSLSAAQGFHYVLFIFLSIVSFYLLSQYLIYSVLRTKKGIFSIVSFLFAVFYALNLYTFYYSYFMFNPQIYIYSILPLNLLALFKIYPLDSSKNSILAVKKWIFVFFLSSVFMVSGFTTYVFFGQYLALVFFYLIFHLFFIKKKLLSFKTLQLFLFFILVFLIHWWWFFPSLLGFKDLYDSQSSLGTTVYFDVGSVSSNLLNSLRLFGSPMMNNNPFSWDPFFNSNRFFPFPLFFFPFLIIFLLLKIKSINNKNVILFLLVIFLSTLFIVKLGNPPLAWITKFAFEHVPFFGAFREAWHKAGLFYVFSYFVLSAIGFACLIKSVIDKKRLFYLKTLFAALFLTGIVSTAPFFIFSYDNIKKINFTYKNKNYEIRSKTKIPPEYYSLKKSIEAQCKDTATIIIPKSSMISNGVWQKYGYSYVGQNILSNLIACNFISAQILKNGPDSFSFAPYQMLEKGDFASFKNFLFQNQIGLVLVRKDNIPYYYTNYIYLTHADWLSAARFLSGDSDFAKTFENDYFSLYSIKKIKSLQGYGFALPQTIVYTNSDLNSGEDYEILSKQIPVSDGSVIINNNNDLKKYSKKINYYAPISNCVGCVKIIPSSILKLPKKNALKEIKDFLKVFFKRGSVYKKFDEQMSLTILSSTYEFVNLMSALYQRNTFEIKDRLKSYSKLLGNIENLSKQNKNNFFDKNSKFIETKMFMSAQNEKLAKYLNSDQLIKDDHIRGQLYFLLFAQNSFLEYIEQNIWETDYVKKIYRTRLDVPKTGTYSCKLEAAKEGLQIKNILIDDSFFVVKSVPYSTFYGFSKGSYPITVQYDTIKNLQIPIVVHKSGTIQEVQLGPLLNGTYKLAFDVEATKGGKLIVALSNRKLNSNILKQIEMDNIMQSDFLFVQVSNISDYNDKKFEKVFSLGSLDQQEYYMYLISSDSKFTKREDFIYKNLIIEKQIEDGSIKFYCSESAHSLQSQKPTNLKVKKINPVRYELLSETLNNQFLSFNQSFSKDWEAYTYRIGKKHVFAHLNSGYANAWYIDELDKNNKIIVEYSGQNILIKNAIFTIIAFIVLFVLYLKLKNNE